MEDACSYTDDSPFKYNHEQIGCSLSKRILEEINPCGEIVTNIVSKVLNKKINDVSRGPVEILLKNLVDGSIDTDKGDYVRRDSYHCGVVYGVYDADRLWDNIIITDTNTIGINEKGALESWSLRLARYKMNKNVYKHHVRHITDALLIEIISMAFSKTASDPARQKRILPFEDENPCQLENNIVQFCFWNDNTLLESLNDIEDSKITHRIESFMARNLYKRCFVINLTRDYPEIVLSGPYSESGGCVSALHKKIRAIQEDYSNSGINFNYILDKDSPPPVFEDDVQKKIRIYDNKEYIPLAQFLGFKVNDYIYSTSESGKKENSEDKGRDSSFLCDHYLHIFSPRTDRGCKDELKKVICSSLSEFSVKKSLTKEPSV
jgi:HD superfamily phosphohydrolase